MAKRCLSEEKRLAQSGIQLIVGLGNPGEQYASTRHNAGAWFVEGLARLGGVTLRPETRFRGLHGLARFEEADCHLFIPMTYMNHSGQAVKLISHFYKLPPESILIAHDEIDLPAADVRLKFDGGAGGHNGLTDIIRHLNTRQFYRLRIGVGRPSPASQEVVDYVLNPPKKQEREQIDMALLEANNILPLLLTGQFQKAMHRLHTLPKDGM